MITQGMFVTLSNAMKDILVVSRLKLNKQNFLYYYNIKFVFFLTSFDSWVPMDTVYPTFMAM